MESGAGGLFANSFQGGSSVDVFTPQARAPDESVELHVISSM